MNKKSILFSILSIVLFILIVFATVALFKMNLLLGILGIVMLIFPAILQRKALDEAEGLLDKLLAKYIVPVLIVVLGFLAIMSVGFWIQ